MINAESSTTKYRSRFVVVMFGRSTRSTAHPRNSIQYQTSTLILGGSSGISNVKYIEVTLMLVAESETVRQMRDRQGKGEKDAIAFAQHIVTIASQHQSKEAQTTRGRESIELEM